MTVSGKHRPTRSVHSAAAGAVSMAAAPSTMATCAACADAVTPLLQFLGTALSSLSAHEVVRGGVAPVVAAEGRLFGRVD